MTINSINQKCKVIVFTAVLAISPRNRHQPAPKGTLIYIQSITGPVPTLSKTDRPGLGAGTVSAQEAPTTTDPNIGSVPALSSLDQNHSIGTKKDHNHDESCPKTAFWGFWPNFHCRYLPKY